MTFEEVQEALAPLLDVYAPPVQGRHEPERPYWHLRNDGLWVIPGADTMRMRRPGKKFPIKSELRGSAGFLPEWAETALSADPTLLREVAKVVLDKHFLDSWHESITRDVGLDLDGMGEEQVTTRRSRDPAFPREVLRAYEHRCVVTGFRAALDGRFLGVEAAHVRAHKWDGPDEVANGLVLTPTMHKLFDYGAWSLTDDRRVLVSSKFTGTDEATELLRRHHGRQIRTPLPGSPQITETYIKWHREPAHGGVFRAPSLPL